MIGAAIVDPIPVIIVFPVVVELKVIAPVADHVVTLDNDMLPEIAKVPVELNIQPVTVTDMLRHASAPVIVTVPATPELELKKTLSAAVGTDAPLAPPDVADHLAVDVVSQVPAPPTQ